MKSLYKNKTKELPMTHKQYSVLSNKKSETQTKKLDWEKEFDNKFKDEKFGPSNYTHYFEESRIYKLIKDFISSLLQKQRTELLEQILNLECLKEEKLIDDTKVDCMILEKTWEDNDLKVIRNQLRKEIKDEINKL